MRLNPTIHGLEDWLVRAALQEKRLDEYRAFRDQGRRWIERADRAGAIASADEMEYALYVLDDTVETLESMHGSRGDIPLARAELEQLRARERGALGSTEPGR